MNIVSVKLKSKKLSTNVPVTVLLPEPPMGTGPVDYYTAGKKYKVLWLLHGATVDGEDFLTGRNITGMLRGHEVITVLPSAINSDYANHAEFGTGFFYTDFFFEELMPFVHATFPASSDPKDNYLAGYSMGGAGTLLLGFLHPERFGGLAPMGASLREADFLRPYANMTAAEFRTFAEENRTALPTEFGPPEKGITDKEINMIVRYRTVGDYIASEECTWERFPEALSTGKLPKMFFCCGDRDNCYPPILKFKAYADSLGATNISYATIPGRGHDCGSECVAKMIDFFAL